MHSAIVLFAHGARDPEWAQPFEKICSHLQRTLPDTSVVMAFLDCMQPTLADAVNQLSEIGICDITLIPMFLARGGHLKQDMPRLLTQIQQQHPELTLHISPAIGEVDAILHSLSDWVLQEHQRNSAQLKNPLTRVL